MEATLEQGLIYGVMALGVYLTFRVLNFPDLTVDGSFTTGAATAASLMSAGTPSWIATLAGGAAGAIAGAVTGILYTKGKIDGLLAGILVMIALWSVNLRIMGTSNLSLLRTDTLLTPLRDSHLLRTWVSIVIFVAVLFAIKLIIDWFLTTDLGLAIQATGNNEQMIRSLGVNTHSAAILTLALSNGLVGICGALIAQYQGFADISMGIGLILIGLAAVIVGQAILPGRGIFMATLGAAAGAVIYWIVIYVALRVGFNTNDMKLISAALVVAALLLPRWGFLKRIPSWRQIRAAAASPGSDAPLSATDADAAGAADSPPKPDAAVDSKAR